MKRKFENEFKMHLAGPESRKALSNRRRLQEQSKAPGRMFEKVELIQINRKGTNLLEFGFEKSCEFASVRILVVRVLDIREQVQRIVLFVSKSISVQRIT